MAHILVADQLSKTFPGSPPMTAVDSISFHLGKGEILGLLGCNGAGKTTTIQMLLGTLTYSSGSIQYFGKEFSKHRTEVLQHITFASTYANLPWKLTIEQNLNVFGRLYSLSNAQIKKRRDPLLERFGIADKLKTAVSQLSAGQLTRLILVKAFLARPKIVLLDEPTASLDADMAKEVCSFLLEERKEHGTSMLFTSHKMAEVSQLCDRVLFLEKGKIVANDVPKNLVKTISHSLVHLTIVDGMKRLIHFLNQSHISYTVNHRQIELRIEETAIPHLLTEIIHLKIAFSDIQIHHPTLEDYFLKMAKQ
ncbi:ABC transporter ATP-binding protein [Rhabdochlamydiaceae symbiont of Dictyostelium giganteum]|uniref:ABC transporter ATP-binding protein n=1 Tax=Rhabdochlamydiaceae symbiont of Dictyostelium giganteum TaxID=3342349 RepID=UPI00384E1B8E